MGDRTIKTTAQQVDTVRPSTAWAYEVIVPPDGAIHTLTDIGFGYYVAPVVAGSDRAVRTISIQNPVNQLPGGFSLFAGSPDSALFLPWEITPGAYYTFTIDKLSGLAIANYSAFPVTANIWLMATTSA